MSRIGKKPVVIPAGVTVEVAEGNVVTVKLPYNLRIYYCNDFYNSITW